MLCVYVYGLVGHLWEYNTCLYVPACLCSMYIYMYMYNAYVHTCIHCIYIVCVCNN